MNLITSNSVSVFIDADNISSTAQLEEAWKCLSDQGWVPNIRRAYGSNEKLAGLREALYKLAIRSFVNQGKGTTDVALVVDVMDLLHTGQLPSVVILLSSDLDFAPLAVRLRESGRVVHCFAVKQTAAEQLPWAYENNVTWIGLESSDRLVLQPAQVIESGVAVVAKAAQVLSSVEDVSTDEPARVQVQRVLDALPKWLPDTVKPLNKLGVPLREKGLHKGSKPLHELFRKFPEFFKVLPSSGAPRQVRLLRKP
jgi:NYN domain